MTRPPEAEQDKEAYFNSTDQLNQTTGLRNLPSESSEFQINNRPSHSASPDIIFENPSKDGDGLKASHGIVESFKNYLRKIDDNYLISPKLLYITISMVFYAVHLFRAKFIQTYLGLTKDRYGEISSIMALVGFLSMTIWSGIADKMVRHRLVLVFLCCASTIAFEMSFFARSITGSTLRYIMSSIIFSSYSFFLVGIMPLTDTLTLKILSSRPGGFNRDLYGRQRLWGTISYGFTSLVVGSITGNKEIGYSSLFFIVPVFAILSIIIIFMCVPSDNFSVGGFLVLWSSSNKSESKIVTKDNEKDDHCKNLSVSEDKTFQNDPSSHNHSQVSVSLEEENDSALPHTHHLITHQTERFANQPQVDLESVDQKNAEHCQVQDQISSGNPEDGESHRVTLNRHGSLETRKEVEKEFQPDFSQSTETNEKVLSEKEFKPVFKRPILMLLSNPNFMFMLLVVFMTGSARAVMTTFLSAYWDSNMKLSELEIAIASNFGIFLEIVIFLIGPNLIRVCGIYWMLILAQTCMVVRCWAYVLLSENHKNRCLLVWAIELLKGLSFGFAQSAGVKLAADCAPPGLEATAQALYSSVYSQLPTIITAFIGGRMENQLLFIVTACVSSVALLLFIVKYFCDGSIRILGFTPVRNRTA